MHTLSIKFNYFILILNNTTSLFSYSSYDNYSKNCLKIDKVSLSIPLKLINYGLNTFTVIGCLLINKLNNLPNFSIFLVSLSCVCIVFFLILKGLLLRLWSLSFSLFFVLIGVFFKQICVVFKEFLCWFGDTDLYLIGDTDLLFTLIVFFLPLIFYFVDIGLRYTFYFSN